MMNNSSNIGFFDDVFVAVIAGGQGTRLFPFSNAECPKQFCELNNHATFIQATITRFTDIGIDPSHILVITTDSTQYELAREQTAFLGIDPLNVYVIDPHFGYAGAMVKAAEFVWHNRQGENSVIINTPADQHIVAGEEFENTICEAVASAARGLPTIVGVKNVDLSTAMGCGHARYKVKDSSYAYNVVGFIEKPDEATAKTLMQANDVACNTGINVWRTDTILNVVTSAEIPDDKELKTDELMRRFGQKLQIVVGSFAWHDCGTLKSLFDVSDKDDDKNVILGQGRTHLGNSRRNLVYAPKGVNICVCGLHDCAIVANWIEDKIVVTVVSMDKTQQVRELANDYEFGSKILGKDLTLEGRNNIVVESTSPKEVICGFIGVSGICITPCYDELYEELQIIISHVAKF